MAVRHEVTMPPDTRAELRNAFFRSLDNERAGAIAGLFRPAAASAPQASDVPRPSR